MSNKKSFAANIRKRAIVTTEAAEPIIETRQEVPASKAPSTPKQQSVKKASNVAPSRKGKKGVVTYIDEEGITHLKVFCAKNKISQQQLVLDALNEYFIKRNEPGIF